MHDFACIGINLMNNPQLIFSQINEHVRENHLVANTYSQSTITFSHTDGPAAAHLLDNIMVPSIAKYYC